MKKENINGIEYFKSCAHVKISKNGNKQTPVAMIISSDYIYTLASISNSSFKLAHRINLKHVKQMGTRKKDKSFYVLSCINENDVKYRYCFKVIDSGENSIFIKLMSTVLKQYINISSQP